MNTGQGDNLNENLGSDLLSTSRFVLQYHLKTFVPKIDVKQ